MVVQDLKALEQCLPGGLVVMEQVASEQNKIAPLLLGMFKDFPERDKGVFGSPLIAFPDTLSMAS